MSKEWTKIDEKNGKKMRKTYLVTWDEEPERISKKTGKPCKERYQSVSESMARQIYDTRIKDGKKNVELIECWD